MVRVYSIIENVSAVAFLIIQGLINGFASKINTPIIVIDCGLYYCPMCGFPKYNPYNSLNPTCSCLNYKNYQKTWMIHRFKCDYFEFLHSTVRLELAAPSSDNKKMFKLPSLLKTAYYACNEIERNKYDLMETPDVDMRYCCELLFEALKIEGTNGIDRRTMFSQLQSANNDQKIKNIICEEAALYGHIDCLKLAHEIGVPWDESTCCNAALIGRMDCLVYARENGCPWDESSCSNAASGGHFDCLLYARENGCPWDQGTCRLAALNGHMDILVYARKNGCPWDVHTCSSAALNGHIECMTYARKNGCPWDEWTCTNAAFNGHLHCLIFARKNGCPWDKWTCSRAALNGHKDCLVYALENGCPSDEWTCRNAAARGNLSCLIYAHEKGCRWDAGTCSAAAVGGHFECLVYAHVAGCEWNSETFINAKVFNHTKCLKYARVNGCPRGDSFTYPKRRRNSWPNLFFEKLELYSPATIRSAILRRPRFRGAPRSRVRYSNLV